MRWELILHKFYLGESIVMLFFLYEIISKEIFVVFNHSFNRPTDVGSYLSSGTSLTVLQDFIEKKKYFCKTKPNKGYRYLNPNSISETKMALRIKVKFIFKYNLIRYNSIVGTSLTCMVF